MLFFCTLLPTETRERNKRSLGLTVIVKGHSKPILETKSGNFAGNWNVLKLNAINDLFNDGQFLDSPDDGQLDISQTTGAAGIDANLRLHLDAAGPKHTRVPLLN